eukprot:5347283-Alexandrium_andersonii.AAC.1
MARGARPGRPWSSRRAATLLGQGARACACEDSRRLRPPNARVKRGSSRKKYRRSSHPRTC